MRYPKHIIVLWIAILVVAAPFAYKVIVNPQEALTYEASETSDDTESSKGMAILGDADYFKNGGSDAEMMVVLEYGYAAELANISTNFMTKFAERVKGAYDDGARTVPMGNYSSGGTDGVFLVVLDLDEKKYNTSDEVPNVRDLVSKSKKDASVTSKTYVTGNSAIYHDTEVGAMDDVKKIDPFAVLLVLILIGLFFRSAVSATMPPVVIGAAYAITLMFILGLAQFMSIYYITSTLVLVTMLGAGCDYCIFIMARYREERKKGKDTRESLREAVTWAGESITISGLAVVIGFGTMSVCSYNMVSTMGIAMAAGILFALLAALTLIPSIIALIGDKTFWPSTKETYDEGSKPMQGWYGKFSRGGKRYFTASSRFAIKHPLAIIGVALLITVPLGYVAATQEASYDNIAVMPPSESRDGIDSLVENAPGGMIMPVYVVSEATKEIATFKEFIIQYEGENVTIGIMEWDAVYGAPYRNYTGLLAQNLLSNDEIGNVAPLIRWDDLNDQQKAVAIAGLPIPMKKAVEAVLDPATYPLIVGAAAMQGVTVTSEGQIIDYIVNYMTGGISDFHEGRQYVKTTVLLKEIPTSDSSMKTVPEIRKAVGETAGTANAWPTGEIVGTAYVTGTTAVIYDMSEVINKEFVLIEVLVMVLIFIMLFFVMKSYLTPLRAILTIAMSIVWTLGLTHIVFTMVLGTPVYWIMPIVLFVICLGLGMDYDIFLTTRIRENVAKGMGNDEAISSGLISTGAVITICGIIMSSAFGTMMLSSSAMLQQFGFALWFAILVDALIVRTYLVPAVMHLLGRWNWVGPKWLQKGEYDHIHEETPE
ncbi:MAG: MMPL family transporter [Thermoplasmatales archaeon]|nr:MMPL family transporter [Thermoplasmatales archaeon]